MALYEVEEEVRLYPKMSDFYPQWHKEAACGGMSDEDWFGPREERRSMSPRQIKKAAAICDSCPVFAQCLRNALENQEQYGVWGGTSGRVRRRIQTMITLNVVTVDEVVEDYCNGQRDKYEEQGAKRRIDSDLRGRKDSLRAQAAG